MGKEIIIEATGGAASFLQTSSSSDPKYNTAVRFVRELSKKYKSASLAQLSSRMASSVRLNRAGDVFDKVRGLITDMIDKLEAEAEADQTEKAYCDKELAETKTKEADKSIEIETLTTKIDQMSSRSAKLKEQVATLQKELAELASAQAEMDKVREQEKALYEESRPELEKGVEGIKKALKVLRDYYAKDDKSHDAAEGAGAGIIVLLEVAESDFSKGLAEMIATEESAQAEYDAQTKENELEKTTKDQDVKFKTKKATELEQSAAPIDLSCRLNWTLYSSIWRS